MPTEIKECNSCSPCGRGTWAALAARSDRGAAAASLPTRRTRAYSTREPPPRGAPESRGQGCRRETRCPSCRAASSGATSTRCRRRPSRTTPYSRTGATSTTTRGRTCRSGTRAGPRSRSSAARAPSSRRRGGSSRSLPSSSSTCPRATTFPLGLNSSRQVNYKDRSRPGLVVQDGRLV